MTLTRRGFLSRGSIGVAIAGGLALVPVVSSMLKTSSKPAGIPLPAAPSSEPLVAHVRNVANGEISLMVGTDHVVIRDTDLTGQLYAAALRSRSTGR